MDEILNLIESVSEDFPTYSFTETCFLWFNGKFQGNFKLNVFIYVFIYQMVWYVPCMVSFVLKGRFLS